MNEEINLDEWKWLREVDGNDLDTVAHYQELARKNEALIVAIFNKYAFNIYVPEPTNKQIVGD